MREVILYGKMRKQFGKSFMLDVKSPAEAVHALMCVVDGFREWLKREARAGAEYHVFCGQRNISRDELQLPAKGEEAIRIAPAMQGAKGGTFMKIVGVVLIVVGAVMMNPYIAAAGFALLVSGVMMDQVPPALGVNDMERDENKPSAIFDGAVNTEAAGHPYALLYGKILCGSSVGSAGLYTEEYPIV